MATWVHWQAGVTGKSEQFRTVEMAESFARDTMVRLATLDARCHVRVTDSAAVWTSSYQPRVHYVKQQGERQWTLYRGAPLEAKAPETVRSPRPVAQAAE